MKTIRGILTALSFLIYASVYPIGDFMTAGGRAAGMGNSSVAFSDFWSLHNNPAGTAWLRGFGAGVYCENRFLLKELTCAQLGVVYGSAAGTFGLDLNYSGTALFNEIKTGLSYARRFGKYFSAGVKLDYYRISSSGEYGSKNLFSCEVGLLFRAERHISVGVHILNPVPVTITANPRELLPVVIRLGGIYAFTEEILVTVEVEKDLDHKPVFRAGAEFHFIKMMSARIGMATNPTLFSFGIGLEFSQWRFDLASGYHMVLGFSPGASLIYQIKNKYKNE